MIKIRKLIKREDLPNWLNNPDITKVELESGRNRRIKNPELYEIYIFVKINDSPFIYMIIGCCKAIIKNNQNETFLEESDKEIIEKFLRKSYRPYISYSTITKFLTIQSKYNFKANFSISKKALNLMTKYVE